MSPTEQSADRPEWDFLQELKFRLNENENENEGELIDIEVPISLVARVSVRQGEDDWRGALTASAEDDVAEIVEALGAADIVAEIANGRVHVVAHRDRTLTVGSFRAP